MDEDAKRRLLEDLAELEHVQWMEWTMILAKTETLEPALLAKWKESWKEYSELPEALKEQDRIYARRVLQIVGRYIGE
jgi:hypothetical protein